MWGAETCQPCGLYSIKRTHDRSQPPERQDRYESGQENRIKGQAGHGAREFPEFLRMRNVDVARGQKVVLQDVNLRIATGEHIAILGPNGCGKSTLIKAMTCECYPIVRPGMEMKVYGRDRWEVQELRKHLGVVATELPGERTSVTRGLDAVVSGFFSSSTLWPNLVGDRGHAQQRAGCAWPAWGGVPARPLGGRDVSRREAPGDDRAGAGAPAGDVAAGRAKQCARPGGAAGTAGDLARRGRGPASGAERGW